MRRRTLILGLAAAAALAVGSLPVLLAARNEPTASLPPDRISPAEHQHTIEAALKPPRHGTELKLGQKGQQPRGTWS